MYAKLISDFRAKQPDLPHTPDIELGLAIKQIRLRMGMTQNELAQNTRIKPTALKTLENGYAKFTTASNLEAISRVLRVNLGNILLEAREWFIGNFFVMKQTEPPQLGARRKKRRIETWLKRKSLSYEGFSIDMATPAISSPAHFCFCLIEIQGSAKIENLKLTFTGQVAGFLQRGSLRILYDHGKELDVFGNQGFTLRGDKVHHFHNPDPDNPARLFLAFPVCESGTPHPIHNTKRESSEFSVGNIIQNIRASYAPSRERSLSFADLAGITGLDEKSLYYLGKTTEKNQVIYWDKLETIAQTFRIPFSKLLEFASHIDHGYLQLATAHDRAMIDYRHYLGVQIKSILFPSPDNSFQMAEVYINPPKGLRRASWKRKDHAMIAIYVEDGEIRLEVGKNRKARLTAGESLYFDGSLEYLLTNPSQNPCKLIMASYPAIIF